MNIHPASRESKIKVKILKPEKIILPRTFPSLSLVFSTIHFLFLSFCERQLFISFSCWRGLRLILTISEERRNRAHFSTFTKQSFPPIFSSPIFSPFFLYIISLSCSGRFFIAKLICLSFFYALETFSVSIGLYYSTRKHEEFSALCFHIGSEG